MSGSGASLDRTRSYNPGGRATARPGSPSPNSTAASIRSWTATASPTCPSSATPTAGHLTRGFKAGKDLDEVLKELAREVPLGAVNLKKCLTEALDSFEVKAGRRRVLLYMGDGKSVADPLDADGRAALCDVMVKKQI